MESEFIRFISRTCILNFRASRFWFFMIVFDGSYTACPGLLCFIEVLAPDYYWYPNLQYDFMKFVWKRMMQQVNLNIKG